VIGQPRRQSQARRSRSQNRRQRIGSTVCASFATRQVTGLRSARTNLRTLESGFCEDQVKESEALLGQISQMTNCVKNQRVDLSSEMIQQIQQLTKREFTKFVSSKGVLHSSDPHSLDQMSFHDLAGHHSWLNAVRSELRSCLMHYQDCKRKAPSTTQLAY
jgi:hypothetical protein